MRNLKAKMALPLIGAALSLGSIQVANAGALATSVVDFTNFEIFDLGPDGPGGIVPDVQLDASKLGGLSYTNSADVNASLSGTSENDAGAGTPLDLFASVGADTSTATGSGIYDDNDFTKLSSDGGLPTGGGNFAISDTNEVGYPITGLGTPTDADVSTASYVSLDGNGIGSSQSNNELTSSFSFTALTASVLMFEFDVDTFVEAFLDGGEIPSKSSAGWSIDMTLQDLTTGAYILDFGLTCSVSRTAPFGADGVKTNGFGVGDCGLSETDMRVLTGTLVPTAVIDPVSGLPVIVDVFTPAALIVGNNYEFTASIQTRADATFIPAPGALALVGIGLLGLYGAGRRKKA